MIPCARRLRARDGTAGGVVLPSYVTTVTSAESYAASGAVTQSVRALRSRFALD
jgi:hypothetical protein